jgi:hypothetical protein
MWTIARVDENPYTGEVTYFEVQSAYRKATLSIRVACESGFVGPDDELVIISPSGRVSSI